ncbi:MAG: hypothetical protein C0616_09875 [Desulfuromonas sp.]|nr:MAG: hypothetical protein C0616_09875 [Desulfuromonas sp.]
MAKLKTRSIFLAVLFTLVLSSAPFSAAFATGLQPAPDDTFLDEEFDDPFAEEESSAEISDPIEPVNRAMFWFNDKLYFYLFKPVAKVWRIFPEPMRNATGRVFDNLGAPVRALNSALQFNLSGTGREVGRFTINTTIGLLGLFDPAKSWFELEPQKEDFGQTLGKYGAGPGFYLVLPVFGPSNLRDSVGLVGDYFVDPISSPYYFKLKSVEQIALKSTDKVNFLSLDADTYEGIAKESLDPYLTIRSSYTQYRETLIKD